MFLVLQILKHLIYNQDNLHLTITILTLKCQAFFLVKVLFSKIFLLEWYQLMWTERWPFFPLLIVYHPWCFGRISAVFIFMKFHYDTVAWTLVRIFILGALCYLVCSSTICKMSHSLNKHTICFNDRWSLLLYQDDSSFFNTFHLQPQAWLSFS